MTSGSEKSVMTAYQYDSTDRRYPAQTSAPDNAGTDWLQTIWAPRVLSIVRIVCGLIFMEHGTQKWLGFPPSGKPTPDLFSISGFGGVLELIGGALLVFGLCSRVQWRSCSRARWRSPTG